MMSFQIDSIRNLFRPNLLKMSGCLHGKLSRFETANYCSPFEIPTVVIRFLKLSDQTFRPTGKKNKNLHMPACNLICFSKPNSPPKILIPRQAALPTYQEDIPSMQ
jgi:hypothetical protein